MDNLLNTLSTNTFLAMQVYGLAIVISLLVAIVIRGVVGVLSKLKRKTDAVAVPAGSVVADGSNGDHIAAITAAVWAMTGHFRIVHIEPTEHGRVWTAEGRITHHASHTVKHR